MDKIRIGIVGAGQNTVSSHIPLLQAIDGVEIVSVCNRSRASSERVATQFGIAMNWPLGSALSMIMLLIVGAIITLSDRFERAGRLDLN